MRRTANSSPALTLATAYPTDRERIWAAIRGLGEFTLRRLEKHSGANITKCKDYVRCLCAAGICEAVQVQRFTESRYRLVRDCGVDAPRLRKDGTVVPPDGRTRMWQAMPVLGSFNPAELARAASLLEAPVAEGEAEYYCRWLVKGGYLVDGPGPRFMAVPSRRTGPKSPQVQRVKRLFDPNTGEIHGETVSAEGGDAA